jgi:hypothetical protein
MRGRQMANTRKSTKSGKKLARGKKIEKKQTLTTYLKYN